MDCQLETQTVMGYDHWIVDLEFEANGRLSDARVISFTFSFDGWG